MQIGSTPIYKILLPFSITGATEVQITFAQDNKVILQKRLTRSEVTLINDGKTAQTQLTQTDTFLFKNLKMQKAIEVQLRAVTATNGTITSKIMRVGLDKCLDSVVLPVSEDD